MNRPIHFQCKDRRKMSGATCSVTSKLRLAVFLATAVVMLQGVDAQAGLIPEGVDIWGMVVNYGDGVVSNPSLLEVIIETTEGGVVTTENLGENKAGYLEFGVKQTGDGANIAGLAEGIFDGAVSEVAMSSEIMWGVSNNTSLPVEVWYGNIYDAHVDADPDIAVSELIITVKPPDAQETTVVKQLKSDTSGDEEDGVLLDTKGAALTRSGNDTYMASVDPGQTLYGGFLVEYDGSAHSSSFAGSFNVGFTVTDVEVVPVPGAVLLGSIGLGFAGWKLRRRKEL